MSACRLLSCPSFVASSGASEALLRFPTQPGRLLGQPDGLEVFGRFHQMLRLFVAAPADRMGQQVPALPQRSEARIAKARRLAATPQAVAAARMVMRQWLRRLQWRTSGRRQRVRPSVVARRRERGRVGLCRRQAQHS